MGSPVSTHALMPSARPPRLAFGKLLQYEARVAWRVPVGLIFGVALPVLMVVTFGLIPSANTPDKSLGGVTVFSAMFPALLVLALAALSLINLPTHLAEYRQHGILRRIATTSSLRSRIRTPTLRPRCGAGSRPVRARARLSQSKPRATAMVIRYHSRPFRCSTTTALRVDGFSDSQGCLPSLGVLLQMSRDR